MKPLDAGQLRHCVTIEREVQSVPADSGEVTRTWMPIGSVWASIEPISGREYFASQQLQADVTHRVRMRWTKLVGPNCRLRFNGRVLAIVAAINVEERNAQWELMCVEAV